jgi:hypothetical protein
MKPKQRRRNQETALEPTLEDEREGKKDRDKLTQDPPTPQQQKLPFDQGVEQGPTDPEPASTKAAELAIESPEIELGVALLL